MHLGEERAQVTLHAIELGREVSDVSALDLLRIDVAPRERTEHRLAHERREVLLLLRPVAREIRLVSTENV